jgi:hypothetical protein
MAEIIEKLEIAANYMTNRSIRRKLDVGSATIITVGKAKLKQQGQKQLHLKWSNSSDKATRFCLQIAIVGMDLRKWQMS